MAVAGYEESRTGIILAKNELAKKYNVKTAETIWQAKKKCPGLVIVHPHHELYVEYSKKVKSIYYEYTDLVESFGIDECYLDVTASKNLFGDGLKIANILRERIKKELGLTISVGVSFNKAFAKLGSDYKKPDAVTVISEDNFKEFVRDIPIGNLFFVGKEAEKKLYTMCLDTIGKVAEEKRELLVSALGKVGGIIWDYANGLDDSEVANYLDVHTPKSVGNGKTFEKDISELLFLQSEVMFLCEEIAQRLRKADRKCTVVSVKLKSPDLKVKERQTTLKNATYLASDIYSEAIRLIKSSFFDFGPVRAATVTAKNLTDDDTGEQISMFQKEEEKKEDMNKIEDAMFDIKKKYGFDAISYGISGIRKKK
jgi:DNA polymerase-4